MKTPPANPVQRYRQAMLDCEHLLAEVQTKLDELKAAERIDWTSVGDANRLRYELNQIAERLYRRGEYAE